MDILTVADVMTEIQDKAGQKNARRAYDIFEGIYAQRGIIQTPEEVLAAKKSFKAIDDISAKRLMGRYVLPLSAGSGKTTFMLAWCVFIHRHNLDYSVAIASFQVKDCFNLREQLMALGIPEETIAVTHSYSAEDIAKIENACPSTDTPWKRRFLLVTHARLKDVEHRKDPLSFHGEARSIIFWDEEFRSRKGFHFDIHSLRKDISGFIRVANDVSLKGISNEELNTIKSTLQEALTCLESHLEHSNEPKAFLPKMDIGTDTQGKAILKSFTKLCRMGQLNERTISFMEHLVEGHQMFTQGSNVFGYVTVISDEIQQMLILDASYKLSKLSQLDKSVTALDIHVPRTYKNLQVTYMDCPSGRGSTARMLATPKERADLMAKAAEYLKGIPANEAVLIFTYKGQDEFEAAIRRELTLLGLDMNERIITKDGQDKPKYAFLTWGQQNGTNDYMYCRHMCTIGVLDLGTDNIVAQAVAQTEGRYLFDDEALSVQELSVSDCAQRVYQAICRTAIRNHGHNEPCTAALFLNRNVIDCVEILKRALPKAKFVKADPVFRTRETTTDKVLKDVVKLLQGLADDVRSISTIRMFKLLENRYGAPLTRSVKTLVMGKLKAVLSQECFWWEHEGRTLRRVPELI
ncbi:MAG: hypothetical protein DI626_04950 [Micavibrio aeruginosavorus]|uniref:Helicase/UvrB N-terminal domain-containing protein n=1 Tax=Micavibrio aeruginosavorus TaxID=349221 RepID=A0A2W4ZXJ8_9BACT|nr:MAG: hypothetical protein DI626_04950 [Micavibrio aeruginosavorus]